MTIMTPSFFFPFSFSIFLRFMGFHSSERLINNSQSDRFDFAMEKTAEIIPSSKEKKLRRPSL